MTGVLAGKVVVVTGATGGIGSATVRAVAAAGGVPVVAHLGEHDAAARLSREAGEQSMAWEVDVTDWDSVADLLRGVVERYGRIDVLVNNAGVMDEVPFLEMTRADWDATMEVDLTGVFVCSRHAAAAMIETGGGVIVNLASQLAFKGARGYTSYCAAKGGVVSLTRALAREIGPTVRVCAIAPGPVASPMTEPYATPEWLAERTGPLVIDRLAHAEEIAASVVFLASDAASLMHGQTLHANGGGVLA